MKRNPVHMHSGELRNISKQSCRFENAVVIRLPKLDRKGYPPRCSIATARRPQRAVGVCSAVRAFAEFRFFGAAAIASRQTAANLLSDLQGPGLRHRATTLMASLLLWRRSWRAHRAGRDLNFWPRHPYDLQNPAGCLRVQTLQGPPPPTPHHAGAAHATRTAQGGPPRLRKGARLPAAPPR